MLEKLAGFRVDAALARVRGSKDFEAIHTGMKRVQELKLVVSRGREQMVVRVFPSRYEITVIGGEEDGGE